MCTRVINNVTGGRSANGKDRNYHELKVRREGVICKVQPHQKRLISLANSEKSNIVGKTGIGSLMEEEFVILDEIKCLVEIVTIDSDEE